MHALVQAVGVVNLVAFAGLAAIAIWQWRRRRDTAAAWVALSLAALAFVATVGRLLPTHPHGFGEGVLARIDIAMLVLFPYLLYRFTTAFREAPGSLQRFVNVMTSIMVVWTFALPRLPATGEHRPAWFVAYVAAFLFHWSVLALVVAWRLWAAARNQPTVARRRMHMLAFAATAITAAIVLVAVARHPDSGASLAAQLVALASAIAFYLGLAPPRIARTIWRRPEQDRLQTAIEELITLARSEPEVVARVLPPMADIVGAQAIELRDESGEVIGEHNAGKLNARGVNVIEVPLQRGSVSAWTSPYAPFFGAEELQLLRTLGALTVIALDRVRLFAAEHEARLALERADEMKTNFIALASHELRTPVTTIRGFVSTLNRLEGRLPPEQRAQMRESLEAQTERMATLVDQLLDLSRLDAEVIRIRPETFLLRDRLEAITAGAAGERAASVVLEVPPDLVGIADLDAFDRIVSNLITNALRYGQPPVYVTAQQTDRHLRLWVEDRGEGVAPEFVPSLFDRFARSRESRERVAEGTGLGLAIAQSYARAHKGDLLYEPAEPRGARFQLVLPTRVNGNGG